MVISAREGCTQGARHHGWNKKRGTRRGGGRGASRAAGAASAADHFSGVRLDGDGRARRGDDAREPLRRVAEVVLLHRCSAVCCAPCTAASDAT